MVTFLKAAILVVIGWFILFAHVSAKDPPEKPIVYFGLIPLYTPQLMYEKFQPLMDYLSANTPYKFKMRLTKDYEGIINLLQEGKIDIALVGGASYVAAKNKIELIPILKSLNRDGKPFYRSVIIARNDKSINSLSELKGKSFAFASMWSTSGAVVPLYHLYSNGIGLKGLSKYFHLRYHDSVVREVLKGNYDAGAVIDTIAYSYKDKGLKFIFISEPITELTIVA
ncbi:MAG: phosphate/phosphite/phosphonate ABC transporter substrate-binding protein, partial [Deltaproteobacteria bacterium]|nr:phosphate/phosphite/phosphonate ABC transporter substrate-binding protein [Deltaproteobacteria bacterium]